MEKRELESKTIDELEKDIYDNDKALNEFLKKLNNRAYANSIEPIDYGYSKKIGGKK